MLFKNDIFVLRGERFRLLHTEPAANAAWAISIDRPKAWPEALALDETAMLEPLDVEASADANFTTSAAMLKARDKALQVLGGLVDQVPAIFDKTTRFRLVQARVGQVGCSEPTLYKLLRRYWTGGQTPAALLSRHNRCGRTTGQVTAGRGTRPKSKRPVFQLCDIDCAAMDDVIKRLYLKDVRLKITHAYQRLVEQHYQMADGNGQLWVRPAGERPSFKQFEYFLRKNYSLETRLRSREGDKDFERDHRAILGTVLADCQGVGHYYEADATIADVYLVASDDVRRIVGKPTIYLIFDRKSRLIVGWYVGLENPSWVCAMQALCSISQDKREMCERYGVPYDPTDWPAHQVHGREVLADRGELFTEASNQLPEQLGITVTNVPAKRGEWKPVVECGFKQTRMVLQDGTPGFDPPENATRRQGRHYEKDACLTLKQFGAIMLHAIIMHNRMPMRDYELSLKELGDNVEPIPLHLWNHGIVSRAGLLPRFSHERVRMALLPRDEATVTEDGIVFRNCHYTCPEAVAGGWFVQARKRRFKVVVTYDGRLVDTVYVHSQNKRGAVHLCALTPRSEKYRGLSFAEVSALVKFRKAMSGDVEQGRLQGRADFHSATAPIIDSAKKSLKTAALKVSRTARRADTKASRAEELRDERQELAGHEKMAVRGPSAQVVSLAATKLAREGTPQAHPSPKAESSNVQAKSSESAEAPKPLSLAEKVRIARQRMLNG